MPSGFTGFRFPPEVILLAVRWYLRYGLSYRDLEELLVERGIEVDHVTLHRWVQRFTPLLIDAARPCRHLAGDRWFVDETYVKVAGVWSYVYRAVDQHGQVIDVYVSRRRGMPSRLATADQPGRVSRSMLIRQQYTETAGGRMTAPTWSTSSKSVVPAITTVGNGRRQRWSRRSACSTDRRCSSPRQRALRIPPCARWWGLVRHATVAGRSRSGDGAVTPPVAGCSLRDAKGANRWRPTTSPPTSPRARPTRAPLRTTAAAAPRGPAAAIPICSTS